MWGYSGTAADGEPLTIQSTGLGGPSTAVVLEELCDLGLETAVRVGTCRAPEGGASPGELVCAAAVLARDGTSRALGADGRVEADPELTAALGARADHTGTTLSTDLFYDRTGDVVAAAMIDRLVHHADVISMKGDSYRLKDRDLGRVPAATTEDN